MDPIGKRTHYSSKKELFLFSETNSLRKQGSLHFKVFLSPTAAPLPTGFGSTKPTTRKFALCLHMLPSSRGCIRPLTGTSRLSLSVRPASSQFDRRQHVFVWTHLYHRAAPSSRSTDERASSTNDHHPFLVYAAGYLLPSIQQLHVFIISKQTLLPASEIWASGCCCCRRRWMPFFALFFWVETVFFRWFRRRRCW